MATWEVVVRGLVGTPFRWKGGGAGGLDCWQLVQEATRRLGLPVPPDYDYQVISDVEGVIQAEKEAPQWVRQDSPQPGDVVGLSSRERLHHIGILTPYGILHTTRKLGACIMPEASLRSSGYQRIEYYRWVP